MENLNHAEVSEAEKTLQVENNEHVEGSPVILTGNPTPSKKSFIRRIFGKDFNLSEDNQVPTSNDTYLQTRYGHVDNQNKRLENLMADIMEVIKEKQNRNEYACVKEIPYDLFQYEDAIVEMFKSKGYYCCSIKKTDKIDVSRDYIFICWDTFHHTYPKTQENNNIFPG